MTLTTAILRLAVCGLVLGTGLSGAQTIYRIVGPDGKITFSDKPPVDAAKTSATTASSRTQNTGGEVALPFELRQVVARYPVTLYSAANCVPCNAGRVLLQGRGIPFTEYTISTAEDTEALQRLSGSTNLPFLTIGGQRIKGYSEAEWSQFLSAANYPAASVLPANYRAQAPRALVAVQKPATPKPEEEQTKPEDTPSTTTRVQEPQPDPSNPLGIKF